MRHWVIALIHLSHSEEEEKAPIGYRNEAAVLQAYTYTQKKSTPKPKNY